MIYQKKFYLLAEDFLKSFPLAREALKKPSAYKNFCGFAEKFQAIFQPCSYLYLTLPKEITTP